MSYSFLKESKLFIVYGGNKYRIYTTTALGYSQSFAEDSYPVKTLHDQTKMVEGSTITKANPAQFNFDVPLTGEKDESLVLDLLTDLVSTSDSDIETQQLKSFDMYVQTGSQTFKVESCVIASANFDIGSESQFLVSIEGQGIKLTRAGDESYTIPGLLQSETATRTQKLIYPVVTIDSLNMNNILTTNVQVQNNINWTKYDTLHESLNGTMMYPKTYTIDNRVVSGTIQQYQIDANITQHNNFSTNSNITIKAVEVGKVASDNGFWAIQLNPAMYTARLEVSQVYTQSYDFRSTGNTAIGTQITQYS
jgi:hypothetical protein